MAAEKTTSSSRMPSTAWPIEPRGLHHARVHVAHALRHAGRAGRIEPEGDLVGAGIGGFAVLSPADRSSVGRRGRMAGASPPHTKMCFRHGELPEDRLHDRQQRRRDEQRLGAAVGENVGVLFGRQQRVERHRDDAGLDGAPERDREIDGIEQQQGDARLRVEHRGGEQVGHSVAAARQARRRSAVSCGSMKAILSPRPSATLRSTMSTAAL